MLRLITANFGWKLLSLVLAVAVWVVVAGEPEIESIVTVPVQFKNTSDSLEISSDIVSTVKLKLKGLSGRLRGYSATPSPVVLDFHTVRSPGERTFSISEQNLRLPRGIELLDSVPGQLRYVFENKLTRSVPIHVRFSPDGAHPAPKHPRLDPQQMEITGPESRVRSIEYVSTDPIDLSNTRPGETVLTSPYSAEPMVRFVKPRPIRVILDN